MKQNIGQIVNRLPVWLFSFHCNIQLEPLSNSTNLLCMMKKYYEYCDSERTTMAATQIQDLLFNGANWFALPFWTLMIFLPKWNVTQRVMASYLPFVALAGVYAYFFATSLDPQTAEAFSDPQLQLSTLAQLFSQESVMAAGWVHYIVMDLFVGRWIYQQGQATGVWTIHSLILCLFAGPLGLLSHILTQWITQAFFRSSMAGDAEPKGEAV